MSNSNNILEINNKSKKLIKKWIRSSNYNKDLAGIMYYQNGKYYKYYKILDCVKILILLAIIININIMTNLVNEINTEISSEITKFTINDKCIGIKRNKTS
ncbi:hypothetical protein PIROE2DRAFT_6113 [Piromyces sp. E2]|nr:hypothetical protein PIROE2DRAFT_6113 [Piromyces sp. E2]|eukprot:OUM66591.1 hypothetical protein PIROE2DRAFT_6113 [Piromyces sp. E2]